MVHKLFSKSKEFAIQDESFLLDFQFNLFYAKRAVTFS